MSMKYLCILQRYEFFILIYTYLRLIYHLSDTQ